METNILVPQNMANAALVSNLHPEDDANLNKLNDKFST
jgi:hypothetical protein